jgi:hypothetical protein
MSDVNLENNLKGSKDIFDGSTYVKEPKDPQTPNKTKTDSFSSSYPPLAYQQVVETNTPKIDTVVTCFTVPESHQVEYVFEYDEDDDDVEDEEKMRQRLIQIFCLGSAGLGIVAVSSVYVAFYLNGLDGV